MYPRLAHLLTLLLAPLPTVAQSVGSVTLLEGSLRMIRGSNVLQATESVQLRQGDILETSEKGFAQIELLGGAVVALGPASRFYLWHASAGKGSASAAELILLSGWMKAESSGAAFRYETPILAAATGNGTLVFHTMENECDVFLENGAATISEVNSEGYARQVQSGKTGQFYSGRSGKGLSMLARPTPAFIESMPAAFRDTLPPRLAHFKGKPAEPRLEHAVSYAEAAPWLGMPSAWRRGFVERFQSRLSDPGFRKPLEAGVNRYPEWEPILHPVQNPPTTVPNP